MNNDWQLCQLWNFRTIIYLNYFSATMKLVSEKTLLDGTTINNFCFMTVYVPVVYINHKADTVG